MGTSAELRAKAETYFDKAIAVLDDEDEMRRVGTAYVRIYLDAADICLRMAER